MCCSFIIYFIYNVLTENFQQIFFVIHQTSYITIIGFVCNFDFPVDVIYFFFSSALHLPSKTLAIYACHLYYLFSTSFFHLFVSQPVYWMKSSFGHFDPPIFECFDNWVLELSVAGVIRKTNEFHCFSSAILLLFCYSFFDDNHSSGKVVLWAISFFKWP